MNNITIKIDKVSKMYKLGQISGTTLRDELQRLNARIRHKDDPTKRIGAKDYNKGETFMALNGVSFEVKKGERVGIIGHNGAGKSTLLKLLSRVTAPTDGEIILNGRIASMLEVGTGFHGELTGRENIYMNGAILGMTKKEIDAKMEDIIEFSECRQFIDTPVKRYSSGMYVKLAFSVAAHLDSEIMIMDEVLAVGDMAFQEKCLGKMGDVSIEESKTILYVSHNMHTIRQLCTRCIVLDHGKLIYDGNVENAISLYMGMDENKRVMIDYTIEQSVLPYKQWISLLSMCYKSSLSNKFKKGTPINIHIKWKNLEDIVNLCLRIEILKTDGTPVGTAFIYDFYNGGKNELEDVDIILDTSLIVAGKYTTIWNLFVKNSFGAFRDIERVNGLAFEIYDDNARIIWNNSRWGSICLPDLKID